MSVVQALNKATTNVQNRHFDGLTGPQSIYANTRGLSLLAETDQWFKGVQVMLEKLKKQAEMQEKEIAEQKKQIKELHDRDLTTQLAVGTATEIRQRLWANYQKSKGKTSVDVNNNITAGNKAAHHSNVIVDTILTNRGLIDTHTFHELYGITHNTAKPYLGIYSSPLSILYAY